MRGDDRLIAGARSVASVLGSVVTLGTFDGVHLGHRGLVSRAKARSVALSLPLYAYTFDPLPARVLSAKPPRPLISTTERVRRLLAVGHDRVVLEPFTDELSSLEAEVFVEQYLMRLSPRHVTVGFNFHFGRGRGGSAATLVEAGRAQGFTVDVVPAVEVDGAPVSSSRIRSLLEEGDVAAAARLLGSHHEIVGEVVEGDRRGRTIGVPTANVAVGLEIVPRVGVYATRTTLMSGACFGSVTNVGWRPTFSGKELRVETHLFDFDADLYGQQIRVALVERIRDERKFDGFQALVAQIREDAARARAILSTP
ncbi:MAG: bifunctional riboflavin kinase/FAD synthetase [Deltaproteobacteria bacterium]|nr:bifunctional riboflavin kinase/FAD synthetase [Deltaproteobacteria bacterium]